MSIEEIVSALRQALEASGVVRVALLFGSAARGHLRSTSDLDVGYIPVDPDLSLADELGLSASCAAACGREVDLIRLDRASAALRWEVARNHRTIIPGAAGELPRFLAHAALEHADMEPLIASARRRLQRRLASHERGAGQ